MYKINLFCGYKTYRNKTTAYGFCTSAKQIMPSGADIYNKIKPNPFQYWFGRCKMDRKAGLTFGTEHYNQSRSRDLTHNEPQWSV